MRVRSFLAVFLLSVSLLSCESYKRATREDKTKEISITNPETDSLEYELIIIDPGFSFWFETRRKPEWYYSKEYMENWNIQYVNAWNYNCRNRNFQRQHPDNPFDEEIDYRPHTDYGLKLNYHLYHYFLYIEETWGKILPYDRRN